MACMLDNGYTPACSRVRDAIEAVLDELEASGGERRFEGYDPTMTRLSRDTGPPEAA